MSQPSLQPTNNVHFYDFGPFRVDAVNRLLLRDSEIIPLTAKVFDVLLVFVGSNGRMLSKDYLMKRIWPESFVEEGNLTRNVSTLRKALGESPKEHQYILTIPGRGYQFAARVTEVEDDDVALLIEQHSLTNILIEDEVHDVSPAILNKAVYAHVPQAQARNWLPARAFIIAIGGLALICIAVVVYLITTRPADPSQSYSTTTLTSLTSTGDVYAPTISPDGKFLAYSSLSSGGFGLRVRQIVTGSDVQVVAPRSAHYWGITFSRDSNYIYYVLEEVGTDSGSLFRVPTIGGRAEKLLERVNGGPMMSPDGRYVGYRRIGRLGTDAFVADLDGKNERQITSPNPPFDIRSASWSPDNKSITYVIRNRSADGSSWYVAEIPFAGSAQKVIVKPRRTEIFTIAWLPDYSGLIMSAIDPVKSVSQLSFVHYPSGEERPLTNDLNNYKEVSVTSDSRTVVAQRMGAISQLWIAPRGDSNQARLLSTAAGLAYHFVAWLPNDDLIFDAEENGVNDIWKTSFDGKTRERLTHQQGQNHSPAATADGRYIVFVSTRDRSAQLWRMDADGNNVKQLTNALSSIVEPKCTPDGKWVFFASHVNGEWRLLKTPIGGGSVAPVVDGDVGYWSVSPKGELLAYSKLDQEKKTRQVTIVRLDDGEPVKSFDIDSDRSIEWLKDGSGITYVGADNRNIWLQLLSGGPARQLTHLKPDLELINFAWSNNGSQLAYTRGTGTFDAVALTFK